MAALNPPVNFIIIPENLRRIRVGRIMPPNLLPQIVAAVMAAQPQPIANPQVAQPIMNVAQPNNDAIIAAILAANPHVGFIPPAIANVAQPNNDAIIAAILAAQPLTAPGPGPAIRPGPAIPLVNNDNALIAAIIAMQQTQPNDDDDDDDAGDDDDDAGDDDDDDAGDDDDDAGDDDDDDAGADEVVQPVKQYDENIDCIDVNDDNNNIGCVPK